MDERRAKLLGILSDFRDRILHARPTDHWAVCDQIEALFARAEPVVTGDPETWQETSGEEPKPLPDDVYWPENEYIGDLPLWEDERLKAQLSQEQGGEVYRLYYKREADDVRLGAIVAKGGYAVPCGELGWESVIIRIPAKLKSKRLQWIGNGLEECREIVTQQRAEIKRLIEQTDDKNAQLAKERSKSAKPSEREALVDRLQFTIDTVPRDRVTLDKRDVREIIETLKK